MEDHKNLVTTFYLSICTLFLQVSVMRSLNSDAYREVIACVTEQIHGVTQAREVGRELTQSSEGNLNFSQAIYVLKVKNLSN